MCKMEKCKNIPALLDCLSLFCIGCWSVNTGSCDKKTALCHRFPYMFWLQFTLKTRIFTDSEKIDISSVKMEARIFSQRGKTELFSESRNVLKAQLNLISLQIAFGFLQLPRVLKRRFFSEKIITIFVGYFSDFLISWFFKSISLKPEKFYQIPLAWCIM